MSDIAIKVEGLGKRYRLGQQGGYKTLRETFFLAYHTPTRILGQRVRGMRWTEDRGPKTEVAGLLSPVPSHSSVPRPQSPVSSQSDHLWALKNVSFEVKRGEAVGIIGRNGSGKSTLLKILSRITAPTEGCAEIHGRVGSLLEVGTGFHPELTGRENIYLNGAIIGMKKAEIERRFDEIVAFAEIEKFLDTPVKRYSSGMYVRLAFAVAAHLEPEVLIVDEVLAVGDAAFQKKCLGKMGDVTREGRTVLFVSHNMAAVSELCERAIHLREGCLVKDGPSHGVIQEYLSRAAKSQAARVWEDLQTAPGNDLVKLCGVRLVDSRGVASSEIRTDEPFSIEVTYCVMRDGAQPGATAVLFSDEGACVFSSVSNQEREWHGKPHPVGVYLSTCQVPKTLLADDDYSLTIVLWERHYNLVCKQEDVLRFRVTDAGEVRGDYHGGWLGVVRPMLAWTTERVG
jgi:lipopolysaccharide transport system ATP-binding protein